MTRYAEGIGDPIAQFRSPRLHGWWLAALGISASRNRRNIREVA